MFIFKCLFYNVEIKIQNFQIKMFSIVGVTAVLHMSVFSDKLLREFRSYQILNAPFIYLAPHNIKTLLNLSYNQEICPKSSMHDISSADCICTYIKFKEQTEIVRPKCFTLIIADSKAFRRRNLCDWNLANHKMISLCKLIQANRPNGKILRQ